MKKMVAGIVLMGLVMIPVLGLTADAVAPTPAERAAKAVAKVDADYQRGAAILTATQKAADQAAANLDKAQADLKLAEASGDKEKIKAANTALINAKITSANTAAMLAKVQTLVDQLKVLLDNAKAAQAKVTAATNPDDAAKAAAEAEGIAGKSERVLRHIESAVKPRPGMHIVWVTIPTTTTSTTQPSPTPVGRRG